MTCDTKAKHWLMQVFSPNLVPYCPSRSLSFIAGLGRTSTGSEFDGSVHPIHESCTTQIRKLVNLELYFILGFNVESASHFERLGAFGRETYHWKGVDERFRTVVRTCL